MRLPIGTLAAALLCAGALAGEPPPDWVTEARAQATTLGSELKQALVSAIETGGPVAAINACRVQAPAIAKRVSAGRWVVGRTALRVRNINNTPDAWEKKVLARFQARLAAGEDADAIEEFAIRDTGQRRFGHWMKAIPTLQLCTTCHGPALPAPVASAIDDAYPGDAARGFSVGDLRGAFTVEVELPTPAPSPNNQR